MFTEIVLRCREHANLGLHTSGELEVIHAMLIVLVLLMGVTSFLIAVAAREEGRTPDLGYGRYVQHGLRAMGFFTCWCCVSSVAALVEPCLFMLHDSTLVFWVGLFLSLAFYTGWSLRKDQHRNQIVTQQLEEHCANYKPVHGVDAAHELAQELVTSEGGEHGTLDH